MKQLRVVHYPQVPCKPFIVNVDDLKEALMIFAVLANYDTFQFENKIKPDYSNTTTLEEYDKDEEVWCDWADEETGIKNIYEYFLRKKHLN